VCALASKAGKSGSIGCSRFRHVFSWAIKAGYVDQTPFKRAGEVVVELTTRAETARTQRLEGDEEARLLAQAGPHLRALVVAALSTGCRLGELLSCSGGRFGGTSRVRRLSRIRPWRPLRACASQVTYQPLRRQLSQSAQQAVK
jgi:hypothetical protein